MVVDAQATAKVNVRNGDARCLNRFYQVKHPVHRVQVGRTFGDLRANVAINPDNSQARQRCRVFVDAQGLLMRYAKFVGLHAGGDVRVGFGIYVGVDANAHRCAQAHAKGYAREHVNFCFALYVKAANACAQGMAHFSFCFTHA